jgi:single-strand DNA-binding protein
MALNKVMVIGYVGHDPQMKALPSGQVVGSFSVTTNENFTGKDGNKQEHVEWHNIVVFGCIALSCEKYLKKGRQVYVEGRLRTREYEAKNNGGKRQRTEIIAMRVQFLGAAPAAGPAGEVVEGDDSDIPF